MNITIKTIGIYLLIIFLGLLLFWISIGGPWKNTIEEHYPSDTTCVHGYHGAIECY